MSKSYTVDRKTAAELLDVSVRTIDRYLSSGRLSSRKRNRNVYISREDILEEMESRGIDTNVAVDPEISGMSGSVDSEISRVVNQKEAELDEEIEEIPVRKEAEFSSQHYQPQQAYGYRSQLEDKVADSLEFYKNLYEVTKNELDQKSEQLNKMTFRLGQLEAQVKSMVPMVEYKKQQRLLEENSLQYKNAIQEEKLARRETESTLMRQIEQKERDLDKQVAKISDMKHQIYVEQKNKAVFAILTFMSLLALPVVWFALR